MCVQGGGRNTTGTGVYSPSHDLLEGVLRHLFKPRLLRWSTSASFCAIRIRMVAVWLGKLNFFATGKRGDGEGIHQLPRVCAPVSATLSEFLWGGPLWPPLVACNDHGRHGGPPLQLPIDFEIFSAILVLSVPAPSSFPLALPIVSRLPCAKLTSRCHTKIVAINSGSFCSRSVRHPVAHPRKQLRKIFRNARI